MSVPDPTLAAGEAATAAATAYIHPRLPPELVSIVLLNLAGDKATLASCTLVHTSWYTSARALLFERVTLDVRYIPKCRHNVYEQVEIPDWSSFMEFLRENPRLQNAVKEFGLRGLDSDDVTCEETKNSVGTRMLSGISEFLGHFEDSDRRQGEGDDCDIVQVGTPVAVLWTRLPLYTLLDFLDLMPEIRVLELDDIFVETPFYMYIPGAKKLLDKLVLRKMGTTSTSPLDTLQFMYIFDAKHITVNALWIDNSPASLNADWIEGAFGAVDGCRTTSVSIHGDPSACYLIEATRLAPYVKNISTLEMHLNHHEEVPLFFNLLRTIGRELKDLTFDLRPVCYVAKPEVYLDHNTYVSLISNFTLFPCISLTHFTLRISVSFDYSGSSNALDCAPQILTTLPPSVQYLTLHLNFMFVVQAAAINLNWSPIRDAVSRFRRQLKQVKILVSNEGKAIPSDERKGVTNMFHNKFPYISDLLKVEFGL